MAYPNLMNDEDFDASLLEEGFKKNILIPYESRYDEVLDSQYIFFDKPNGTVYIHYSEKDENLGYVIEIESKRIVGFYIENFSSYQKKRLQQEDVDQNNTGKNVRQVTILNKKFTKKAAKAEINSNFHQSDKITIQIEDDCLV